MQVLNEKEKSRRAFLKFMGKAGAMGLLYSIVDFPAIAAKINVLQSQAPGQLPFIPLEPITKDSLILADGFSYNIIAKFGDRISSKYKFGFDNDYLAFIPMKGKKNEGLLWVNHEFTSSLFVNGLMRGDIKTKEHVIAEMETVGGSIIHIKKNEAGDWKLIQDEKYNKVISALTPIPFAWPHPILGSKTAIGTLANCAGGVTPWGTVLSAEENYYHFWGERDYSKPGMKKTREGSFGWEKFFDYPPEHYGWIVEIDPFKGTAKKLVSMGRCAHECATVVPVKNNRVVAYSGDDMENEHIYKFIASKPNSLEEGKLYVANIEKGKWLSLQIDEQPILQKHFKDQTEVLIRMREAAKLIGATPMNRPEDIEMNPVNGDILVTLTNNKAKGDFHGSILQIKEKNNDKLSLEFDAKTFLAGGPETGFSCPDNMAFDKNGNLWMTSDMSGYYMNKGEYTPFKNNSLFYIPMSGKLAGEVFRVASGPMDSELTGPFFAPDNETLFLAVQHPGEMSTSLTQLTSNWPDGGNSIPRSSVVAIQGPAMKKLLS